MSVTDYYDFFDGTHEYPINVSLALASKCETDKLQSIKYASVTRTSQKSAFENFVVIDTETTGLSARTAEILEISAIKFEHFRPVSLFTTLCKPEKKIPQKTVEINGITDSMVEDKPRFQQVADSLLEFIGDSNIVGHNLPFDLEFIVRYGADVTRTKRKYFDTLQIAKKVLKKPKGKWDNDLKAYEVLGEEDYDVDNYRLETLCDYYGIEQHHGHRAADDAFVTGFLFEELLDDYCEGEMISPIYSSGTSVYVSNKNETTETAFVTTAFNADVLKSLNDKAFEEYVNGYLNYAKSLTKEESPELIDSVKAQVDLINSEIKRRSLADNSKESGASLLRVIAGTILSFGGIALLFLSWLGALPLLAGVILLGVEYTK